MEINNMYLWEGKHCTIYLYTSDCCCCWQYSQKDKSRSLHQATHGNGVHSSERHISRYLMNGHKKKLITMVKISFSPEMGWKGSILKLTAIAASCGVGFILSIGTLSSPVTKLMQRDAQAGGRTGPFPWVALLWNVICRPHTHRQAPGTEKVTLQRTH